MKRYFIVETLEQLRTISDALRLQILSMLVKEEHTGKQLSTLLSISASKIHYHLKELENQGFVEIVRTEEKNGILQKFYRAVAFDYVISEELLPSIRDDSSLLQESMINQLRTGINRIYDAPEESFRYFAEEDKKPPILVGNGEVKAPREEIKAWLQKYRALLDELWDMERRHLRRVEEGSAEDNGEIFFIVFAGFMTNDLVYLADDENLPDGYELLSDVIVRKKQGGTDEHGEKTS